MKNLFLIVLLALFGVNVNAQKAKAIHSKQSPNVLVLNHPSDKGQAQAEYSRNKHKNKEYKHKKKHYNHKRKSNNVVLPTAQGPRPVGIIIPAPPKPGQLPPAPPHPRHRPLILGK